MPGDAGLLTETEAAARLGYSKFSLRAWRKNGIGPPYVRIGTSIRYEPDELEAWIEAQKVDPKHEDATQ